MKIKSKLFVFFVILCILFSITCVFANDNATDALSYDVESNTDLKIDSDESIQESPEDDEYKSFSDLEHDLNETNEIFDVKYNYKFNEGDSEQSIIVHKETLVINGNGHVFDGGNISTGLAFESLNGEDEEILRTNIIINDLTLRNFHDSAIAIYDGNLTLNNVNFTFSASPMAMLLHIASNSTVTLNNCNFHSNSVENMIALDDSQLLTINNTNFYNNTFSSIITATYSNILINNSIFDGNNVSGSAIEHNRGQLRIEKSKFNGMASKQGGIISYKGDFFTIKGCEFLNSHADLNGGAIIAKYFPIYDYDTESYIISGENLIEDCIFHNLSSANDGGAIYFDMDSGSSHIPTGLNVINSNFTDCSSGYGGAIAVQGAKLNVEKSNFIKNSARVYGGALYTTWSALTLTESILTENSAERNAGAVYFDKGGLTLNRTTFTSNKAAGESFNAANAIYANDVDAYFLDSTFDNGGVSVYANFASDSKFENVTKNDDVFLMDNKDYIVSVETKGMKLELNNDTVIVDTLPSKFDARDMGWVTPEKYPGDNYDCWAFATVASIETALIKSTGNTYNLSQNYIQKLQLKYYPIGDLRNSLTGFAYSGLGHALSWIGILLMDAAYDDRGLILETNPDDTRIHLQDAIFITIGSANHDELIKRAVLEYGAVSVQLLLTNQTDDIPTTGDNISITDHSIHFVSIIGWDDNYTDPEITDEWKGAWLTKDSEDGFKYVFYDEKSLWDVDKTAIIPQSSSVAYIFNNTIDYHVNYQTDLTGLTGFDANYTYYSNEYTSKYTELIGAVGTYFNESGIPYSFDVYVNGNKMHTQTGVSEFAGFRTIILNKYIPINEGDKFKVVFKNSNLPYQAYSRQHYIPGMSLVSADGETWSDITLQNKTVCLKVYTVKRPFSELCDEIGNATDTYEMDGNYYYDSGELLISKEGVFTLNGNGHVIEGINKPGVINIDSTELVIINNLTFKNCFNTTLEINSPVRFNNVTFINCSSEDYFLSSDGGGKMEFNDCVFKMNSGIYSLIFSATPASIRNCLFDGGEFNEGAVYIKKAALIVENTTFKNINSGVASAINYKGGNLTIRNSKFINLHASLTGGAILGKYFANYDTETEKSIPSNPFLIENCEFINLTSTNDGGAIYFDLDSASEHFALTLILNNDTFINCKSKFGGAICDLGGILNITNTTITNSHADFEGGAIYTTWADLNLVDTDIINNSAEMNAGAIYFDKGTLTINKSNLTNNKATKSGVNVANAIYANDVDAYISDSTFANGGIAVYANFKGNSEIDVETEDIFMMDNKDYIVSVESKGIKLNLINNSIIVDNLPSRFNFQDWGWVTPVKHQGDNYDCWAFATVAGLESSLLKATGISYNLSENYVQKFQLKYNPIGDLRNSLTGFAYSGLGYALSWYGTLISDNGYDDRGMIVDTDFDTERIHLQDAMIIFGGKNDTIELIKQAIFNYGPVSVQMGNGDPIEINDTGDDIAIADHNIHFVSLIGWDDGNVEDGIIQPIWFVKDSIGGFHTIYQNDPEILAVDYYAYIPQNAGISFIFENTIDYHVNYQTDLTGLTGFDANYTYYSNEYTSKYSELIGAVGTYFNESGIDYSFDIYVNGNKVHTQTGVSEFAGFRTIILNKYIPVKAGDKFKVVFKNNNLPYQAYSRQHYIPGMSLVSADASSWSDITLQNKTVCLKVYTVVDNSKIASKDMTMTVNDGSYFTVTITCWNGEKAGAGEEVKFTINGQTFTALTDANGNAKLKITQKAGTYTITTSYLGSTAKNTIKINPAKKVTKITLKAKKSVKIKRTAKKLVLTATLKINGKAVKGKVVKFKFKGKTYKAKTNKKGIAKITIKKKVIKKLKKGKKYTAKITYQKKTAKTIVKVKR